VARQAIFREIALQNLIPGDRQLVRLDRLRSAGLTVKPEKVVFATQEISFLGHVISPSGVRIDPERTRAIRDFSPPRDAKGIDRFIGMINLYH
jgi:hypothetical protein